MNFPMPIFGVASPEILLIGMISIMISIDIIWPKTPNVLYFLSQIALLMAGSSAVLQYYYHSGAIVVFYGHYILDNLALLLKLFVYILSILAINYGRIGLKEEHKFAQEYYILCLFSVLGMTTLCCAGSLLTLYLGIELLSLPIYAMIAAGGRDHHGSLEAAVKYFILGGVASAILLYGMSIVYGATGSITLDDIARSWYLIPHPVDQIALTFIIIALCAKFGLVPFHMWMPDAYQGAHNKITVFFAGAPKLAIFAILARILAIQIKPDLILIISHMLLLVAVLSMVLGNLVAMLQTSIKRMLAYSAIAHTGYVLVGLTLVPKVIHGYDAALFYLFVYCLTALGSFGVLVILGTHTTEIDHLHDLRELNARNPWLAFMMLLFMFSMAGVPPSPGFFAKLGLIIVAIQAQQLWLAVLMLVVALIGAYYYLRVVMIMYFNESHNKVDLLPIKLNWPATLVVSGNGLAVLLLGIWPASFIKLCRNVFT